MKNPFKKEQPVRSLDDFLEQKFMESVYGERRRTVDIYDSDFGPVEVKVLFLKDGREIRTERCSKCGQEVYPL